MKKIFKYELEISDGFEIAMPEGAKILCVQTQRNEPMIWVLVDPENKTVDRHFQVFGTGHELRQTENTLAYIGTFQINSGSLVFHLFENIK